MQDEEMDNMDELIKAASESYHPLYDDKAWEKMEVLLDKHLPQKKEDRKKPLAYFLLLVIIAVAVFFAMLYPWNKKGDQLVSTTIQPKQVTLLKSESAPTGQKVAVFFKKGSPNSQYVPKKMSKRSGKNNVRKDFKKSSSRNYLTSKRSKISTGGALATNDISVDREIVIKTNIAFPEKQRMVTYGEEGTIFYTSAQRLKDHSIFAGVQSVKNSSGLINAATFVTNGAPEPAASKIPGKEKGQKGFANNFALTLSAGPDLSFVSLENAGKNRLNYGVGVRYTFAKRINISSGFYATTKIYSAKPSDYHPPAGYWTYSADVERIDADCKVYEIPLSASYNFKQSKNHSWLAGIGFSTFLMKRETYNYLYKDAWGQTMYKGWTLRNKNNHFFSMLTISGGYQYHINQRFSLIAAPYLQVPLYGIGFGKIKLNSGGILITAAMHPFAKKK